MKKYCPILIVFFLFWLSPPIRADGSMIGTLHSPAKVGFVTAPPQASPPPNLPNPKQPVPPKGGAVVLLPKTGEDVSDVSFLPFMGIGLILGGVSLLSKNKLFIKGERS